MPFRTKKANDAAKTLKPGVLLIRYFFALGLILSCVTASHIAALSIIDEIKDSTDLISQSINQKAAASNLVSFAEMASTFRTKAAIERMSSEIDRFERTHERLARAAMADIDVAKIYFEGAKGPALDPVARKFIADGRIVASLGSTAEEIKPALKRMRVIAEKILPHALQEANEGHQFQARGYSNELGGVQSAAFLLALAVLVVEALFIFLPAHRSVSRALDALRAQASRLEEANAFVEARNSELENLRSTAEYEAAHDQLTGLANRRGFEREIERLTASPEAAGQEVAILHIDLDRFKEINDTLGHSAGDAVLRHVGMVLRRWSEPGDFVARIGGDEFVIVREGASCQDSLSQTASRIVARLGEPLEIEGSLCQFGASIGIAIGVACGKGAGLVGSRLIADADIALYHAKEQGRGRVEYFSEEMRSDVEACKALSDELSLGLMRDEFFAVYQPQFDARTGAICGVEALARWRHPQRGEVSPGVFLPIADRLRKTGEIDRIVQNQAIRDLAAWDAKGLSIPSVSINVSASRLRDPELVELLRRHPHAQGRIHVEVLETTFTDVIDDELRHILDALADVAVDVEIDDFGTGHASLLSLLSLKPARLKIARELVSPLPRSAAHIHLVRSICEIAQSLEIGVTAEGVETEAQRAELTGLGCDRLQGFLFARPMPMEALTDLALRMEREGGPAGAALGAQQGPGPRAAAPGRV